ncbi:uncharacterized protein F5891DRAFT_728894 [Suillus fuscotomentosus]|uniref:SAP domain-containing protein n=1 Tax=Suillus fuscotomentosus TaxID=1912939 RepID=A0AAD4HFC5_9AGAM|nr:uncharacterized protein F5891DRAFT_728894 [Suillus fuscotomentosus]KAG1894447.1 hypothetical protein F5891DRAFT_728894 [Suillus fuscotomentosus]
MAPITFSGTIPSKKKADLQAIAVALNISDTGTREDLQGRIKRHLEQHQSKYEDDPTFSGLYGKKKKSVQPPIERFVPSSPDEQEEKLHQSPQVTRSRRIVPLDPRETTPVDDMRNVSIMLKNLPISPDAESTPASSAKHSPQRKPESARPVAPIQKTRPVSKPLAQVAREYLAKLQVSVQTNTRTTLLTTRAVLSDSTNIWFLTVLLELFYILYMVIPWQTFELSPGSPSQFYIAISYPPARTFLTPSFWTVLIHWSIPDVFIPLVFGLLVSFHPANSTSSRTPQVIALDPLSASIARLAAHVAYPFRALEVSLQGVDVIGQKWRLLTASIVVAFAFAEAIFNAPGAFAESRVRLRAATPRRTAPSEDPPASITVTGES